MPENWMCIIKMPLSLFFFPPFERERERVIVVVMMVLSDGWKQQRQSKTYNNVVRLHAIKAFVYEELCAKTIKRNHHIACDSRQPKEHTHSFTERTTAKEWKTYSGKINVIISCENERVTFKLTVATPSATHTHTKREKTQHAKSLVKY